MISFEGLEVSGLLDTGAKKTFISRELIRQVPSHKVVQHAAADMLQIHCRYGCKMETRARAKVK